MTCLGQVCSCWRMTGLLFVAVNSSIKISINHKTSTNTLKTCILNLNFPSFLQYHSTKYHDLNLVQQDTKKFGRLVPIFWRKIPPAVMAIERTLLVFTLWDFKSFKNLNQQRPSPAKMCTWDC